MTCRDHGEQRSEASATSSVPSLRIRPHRCCGSLSPRLRSGAREDAEQRRPLGSCHSGTLGLHQIATKPTDNVFWLLEDPCSCLKARRAEKTSVVYNNTL